MKHFLSDIKSKVKLLLDKDEATRGRVSHIPGHHIHFPDHGVAMYNFFPDKNDELAMIHPYRKKRLKRMTLLIVSIIILLIVLLFTL